MQNPKNTQDQGGPMSIVTAVVLSTLLLAVTGCATSDAPPAAKQETGKKDSTKKPIKRDQERSMNEESMEAVR
jgi:Flp pilus assembly protein TadD